MTTDVSGSSCYEPAENASNNARVALFWGSLGFYVFPVNSRNKRPYLEGGWRNYSTRDPNQIHIWWAKEPAAAVAVDCGKSDLLVIDLDRNHSNGADGVAAFDEIAKQHGGVPDTPRIFTPNGGQHLVFAAPSDEEFGNSTGSLPAGIDVRGQGGYVIASGTVMADGRRYSPDRNVSKLSEAVKNGNLATPPAWLLTIIRGSRAKEPKQTHSESVPLSISDTRERVETALEFICPDDRDVWVKVCGALHDSGLPNVEDIATRWSQRSHKFDAAEQKKLWKSLSRPTGKRTTLGTIFFLAAQNGYQISSFDRSISSRCAEIDFIVRDPGFVELIRADSLPPEPINWLFPGWLARGKLHILGGAPGTGKTTIALGMAAVVSAGGKWPDQSRCIPGNVIIWSGEDDARDTLVPRLMAAGADLARVYFVGECRTGDQRRTFDPARDMEGLLEMISGIGGASLIIVDPIISAVAGDSHKNAETRRALQPLVDAAASCDAVLIGVTHFTKGTAGREPLERITGSIAFGAVARIVLVASKVSEAGDGGEGLRVLCRAKSNIGPDGGGYEYTLEQIPLADHPEIIASRVAFGEAVEGSALEILNAAETTVDEKSAIDDAEDFLRRFLAAGPEEAWRVEAEAKTAGISKASLRRAKKSVGVTTRKLFGEHGKWCWALPNDRGTAQGAQDAPSENLEHLEHLGTIPTCSSSTKELKGASPNPLIDMEGAQGAQPRVLGGAVENNGRARGTSEPDVIWL